jgi:hypothetical protein
MATNSKIKINMDSLKTRREWKRHKVKDGHNVYRVLPPFGEESNGYPYRKWQIIWGLVDPETGRARPFASSMTSEKRCPVTEFVTSLKKKAETLKASLQAAGENEENIVERLGSLNKLISDINPKTIYIYNAADKAGEVGLLELKSTAHKKMKAEMNQYVQDYNQDPTSLLSEDDDSGLWFDVTRTGLGFKTEYDVKKCQVKTKNPQTGKISFEDDRSALPEAVVENYADLAYDLTSVYQIKTYEELAEVLASNMERLVLEVPDADLTANHVVSNGKVANRQPAKTAVKAGAKAVATKFQDDDDVDADIEAVGGTPPAGYTKKASAQVDDDFMNEADAILNQ